MKRSILLLTILLSGISASKAQCPVTSSPTNDCSSGAYIAFFAINNIPAVGNYGCSWDAYSFNGGTPRNLVIGTAYSYSCNMGNADQPQALAVWMDLNHDGFYTANENVINSSPKYVHSGTFILPASTLPYTYSYMRVKNAYQWNIAASDMCFDGTLYSGETEDYWINFVCGATSGPLLNVSPSNTTVCKNAPTVLNVTGGVNYTWTPGNIHASSITITPTSNITYTVTGTSTNCPASTKKIATVNVSTPTVGLTVMDTLVCAGETQTLTASGDGAFLWQDMSTSSTHVFTPPVPGTYSLGVTLTNMYGCTAQSSVTIKVDECLGIAKNTVAGVSLNVWPNPASGSINISASENILFTLCDITGKELVKNFLQRGASYPVEGLKPGVYFVAAGMMTKKIVILE
jgi:hypothetical protein